MKSWSIFFFLSFNEVFNQGKGCSDLFCCCFSWGHREILLFETIRTRAKSELAVSFFMGISDLVSGAALPVWSWFPSLMQVLPIATLLAPSSPSLVLVLSPHWCVSGFGDTCLDERHSECFTPFSRKEAGRLWTEECENPGENCQNSESFTFCCSSAAEEEERLCRWNWYWLVLSG